MGVIMFTYQNGGQGRAGLSAEQAEGVWAKACPAAPLLLQPGLHQTALSGRQLMPPGGQWAGLAQTAPQGLAAVMHPLYSSKCYKKGWAKRREKGKEKGRKRQREEKERAKRREGKGTTGQEGGREEATRQKEREALQKARKQRFMTAQQERSKGSCLG